MKTAYEMRISDWSSDVCSSDLAQQLSQLVDVQSERQDGMASLGEADGGERVFVGARIFGLVRDGMARVFLAHFAHHAARFQFVQNRIAEAVDAHRLRPSRLDRVHGKVSGDGCHGRIGAPILGFEGQPWAERKSAGEGRSVYVSVYRGGCLFSDKE